MLEPAGRARAAARQPRRARRDRRRCTAPSSTSPTSLLTRAVRVRPRRPGRRRRGTGCCRPGPRCCAAAGSPRAPGRRLFPAAAPGAARRVARRGARGRAGPAGQRPGRACAAPGRAPAQAIVRHPVDLFVLHAAGRARRGRGPAGRAAPGRRRTWTEADVLLTGSATRRCGRRRCTGSAAAGRRPRRGPRRRRQRHARPWRGRAASARTRLRSLAAAAAQWVACWPTQVDAGRGEAAARGLHASAWSWDGARLAGQAASGPRDRKAMTLLLRLRPLPAVRPPPAAPRGRPATPTPASAPSRRAPAPAHRRASPFTSTAQRTRARGRRPGPRRADLQGDRRAAVHLGQDRRAPRRPDAPAPRRASRGELFAQLRAALGDEA